MKPAWDKLMAEYKDHASILVADVDCTAEGKSLCDESGVQGFPTIKYGDPSALEDYEGGRDFDELESFAKENLKPLCSPKNIDLCDAEKKTQIEGYMKMDASALTAEIEKKEAEAKEAEETFNSEVESCRKNMSSSKKRKPK